MATKPKFCKAPIAQAIARHRAARAPVDARFGQIDDDAMANQLFTAESDALKVLAETPCASDAEFLKKLRYLHAHETRIGKTPNAAHPPHYLTLKLRALCCVLRAPARRAPFLARGVVRSRRKTSRAVIARTIIDGSTSDMMESSGVSDGKLARRLTGKATSWACAEPIALLPHALAATKRSSLRQRCWTRHFVKTSTKEFSPGI